MIRRTQLPHFPQTRSRILGWGSLLLLCLAMGLAVPHMLAQPGVTFKVEAVSDRNNRPVAGFLPARGGGSARVANAPAQAGVVVDPPGGLETTESSGWDTFDVYLTDAPTATVTIALNSDDPGEGLPSTSLLSFTTSNWGQKQTVTVTGVDDDLDDGDVGYFIETGDVESDDPVYDGLIVTDVSVTNLDDDDAGIVVAPTGGLVTTEAPGGSDTFEVWLTSQPTDTVRIDLSSSDPGEGTLSTAFLTFDAGNWSEKQTVTVTGVDDDVDDGDVGYWIETDEAISSDPGYSGQDPADVSVTNQDDDTAGIVVAPSSGLITTEAAGSDTFDVWLTSQPTDTVRIDLSSSDTGEGTPSPTSVTFDSGDWDQPQTVTVTGVDDDLDDGDVGYWIETDQAISGDPDYAGLDPEDVSVTNQDDDTAGIMVAPTSGLVTTEGGSSDTFEVWLTSAPAAEVTIGLSSSVPDEGSPFPTSLSFLPANWDQPQTVTVTGADDEIDDGDVLYFIQTAAAESVDPVYDGLNAADVEVTNQDDDTAGIMVAPTSGLVTSEGGGTDNFEVWLNSEPTGEVVVGLSSSDPTEGTLSRSSLTFSPTNWSGHQRVAVFGVDDDEDDGDIAYLIVTAPATGDDPVYIGLNPPDVSVTNLDGDNRPVALNDQYVTDEDQVLVVPPPGVLSNDSDENEDPLVAALVQDVGHGALALSADGSFVYTPTLNFFGEDMFIYMASDGILTDTATVNLTVNPINDPPVAVDDGYNFNEDTTLNVAPPGVLENDLDVDEDELTAALVTDVITGSLSFNSNGSFSYLPPNNFNGVVTFTYQTSDGFFTDTAITTLIINPVNDPPVATDDQYITNATDTQPLVIVAPGILANDSDADPDDQLIAILDEPPVNGDVQLDPSGAFTYTPHPGFNGLDMFTYHVSDGSAVSGIAEVQILVDTIPPEPPTWMDPVGNEGIVEVGIEYITLTVQIDPSDTDVEWVQFYRWDAFVGAYVEIGRAYGPPYQWLLYTEALNYQWNQIFARAYDFAGNVSERRFIWLVRLVPPEAYLPLVAR